MATKLPLTKYHLHKPKIRLQKHRSLPAIAIPALFHFALNIAVAIAGLIFSSLILKLAANLITADTENDDIIEPKHLDEDAFASPGQALACAKREA